MKWGKFFGAIWRGIKAIAKNPAVREAVVGAVTTAVAKKVK